MNPFFRLRRASQQRGVFMLELSMVLSVSALLAIMTWIATQRAADADLARLQGDAITALRTAAHRLVMGNYIAYQAGQPITRNGVTLADGDLAGQSRRPTVANLRVMDLSVNSAQDNGMYKALTNASYDFTIERSAVCGINAASPDCHVTGLVCLNQPARGFSYAVGEVDTFALGVLLARLGGSGGISLLGSPGTINGGDGTWAHANPYGAVAGIVCARFGWGSEGDDYLRVADSRDPNFQGGITISGTVPGSTNTLLVNGNVGVADAAGNARLVIGNDGTITTQDASGNTMASVSSDGTISAKGLTLTKDVVLGGACAPNESAGWSTTGATASKSTWTLARCDAGVWVSTAGLPGAVQGNACSVNGAVAQDAAGAQLICSNSTWLSSITRMGHIVMAGTYLMTDGASLIKPTCQGGGTPFVNAMRKSEVQLQFQYVNLTYGDLGSAWQFFSRDQDGAVVGGDFVVQDYCFYP